MPKRIQAELERSFALSAHDSEQPPAREQLLAAVAGAAGLFVTGGERVDGELLDAAGSRLRIVSLYAVGFDNADLEAASSRGIVVSNTPDVLSFATAELAFGLLLALSRRIGEGERLLRSRTPWRWSPSFMLGRSLQGLTLGIVGLGRIGAELARMAEAFEMSIVYTGRSGRKPDTRYRYLSLEELLASADVVSLHCPLTPDTHHLIGPAELAAMKRDAVLVNTTRGPVVDEQALVVALRAGTIAGAALDVFEREPEVSEGLLELRNVVLAPHLGSATLTTREAMGLLCVEALRAVLLEGRCPGNALNPEAFRATLTQ